MIAVPASSVTISPSASLKYTTKSSRTVATPMTMKTTGGTERSGTQVKVYSVCSTQNG